MADSLSDPKLEGEMKKMKEALESLKRTQTIFMNTFSKMKPKERAVIVREINSHHTIISNFINGARKHDLRAPALKFGLENIKQKYQLLTNQWRRTEKLLESASGGASRSEISVATGNLTGVARDIDAPGFNPTGKAVEKYVESLKTLGHDATTEMVDEFRNRLDAAYKTAKEKSGGRDLDIQIIQDGGKIKVRMEPK
jgi:hypothetical protein